jgi:toxin CcdB
MQYHVHANLAPSKGEVLYLLDVQSPLLDRLATRVVVPLYPADRMPFPTASQLSPKFEIEGSAYRLLTPNIAAMPRKWLGRSVLDCRAQSHTIVAALDTLISGI